MLTITYKYPSGRFYSRKVECLTSDNVDSMVAEMAVGRVSEVKIRLSKGTEKGMSNH